MMPGGELIDRPLHSIALRGMQQLLGGQEAWANRGFRNAMSNIPETQPPLPTLRGMPPEPTTGVVESIPNDPRLNATGSGVPQLPFPRPYDVPPVQRGPFVSPEVESARTLSREMEDTANQKYATKKSMMPTSVDEIGRLRQLAGKMKGQK